MLHARMLPRMYAPRIMPHACMLHDGMLNEGYALVEAKN